MIEFIAMILLGTILTIIGILNIRGNISSIHWYNRRKITEENRKPYGRLVGSGTVVIGLSLIITGILQLLSEQEYYFYIILAGALVGLVLIFWAQFKYNKGLF